MVALLTGASRGIGKAIALELARLGYDLAIVGRNRESLEKLAKEATGVRVCPIVADLSRAGSAQSIVEEIVRFLVTRKGNGTLDEFYIRRYAGLAFD